MNEDQIVGAVLSTAASFAVVALWLYVIINTCPFGHDKKWVGITHIEGAYWCVRHQETHLSSEKAETFRWVCEREGCNAMGKRCMGPKDRGRYRIEFGRIVSDEKRWGACE